MEQGTSVRVTFFQAVAAGLTLSLLLTGCTSSRLEPSPTVAAERWGTCDRSRMVGVMLVCRQTKADPVSVLSR